MLHTKKLPQVPKYKWKPARDTRECIERFPGTECYVRTTHYCMQCDQYVCSRCAIGHECHSEKTETKNMDDEIKLNGVVYVKKEQLENAEKEWRHDYDVLKRLQNDEVKDLEQRIAKLVNRNTELNNDFQTERARANKYEACYEYFKQIRGAMREVDRLDK